MRQIKRPRHGLDRRKKPEIKKNLFLPCLAAAMVFLNCSTARTNNPALPPKQVRCIIDVDKVLEADEIVLDTKCTETMKFVLTDRSIITLYDQRPVILDSEELKISLNSMRTDISEYIKRLTASNIVGDVALVESKEYKVEDSTFRQFKLTAMLRKDVHLSKDDVENIRGQAENTVWNF